MELNALLTELAARKALIVHFSHRATMREGVVFPNDLRNAIAHKDCWTLSCCVVWPGHMMELPGEVGLVFLPTAIDQILSVAKTDSGSSQLVCGTELSGGMPLTPETFAETFQVDAGDYNEWRVRGAEPSAIFVVNPNKVWTKQRVTLPSDDLYGGENVSEVLVPVDQIRAVFPTLRLITMTPDGPMTVG